MKNLWTFRENISDDFSVDESDGISSSSDKPKEFNRLNNRRSWKIIRSLTIPNSFFSRQWILRKFFLVMMVVQVSLHSKSLEMMIEDIERRRKFRMRFFIFDKSSYIEEQDSQEKSSIHRGHKVPLRCSSHDHSWEIHIRYRSFQGNRTIHQIQ